MVLFPMEPGEGHTDGSSNRKGAIKIYDQDKLRYRLDRIACGSWLPIITHGKNRKFGSTRASRAACLHHRIDPQPATDSDVKRGRQPHGRLLKEHRRCLSENESGSQRSRQRPPRSEIKEGVGSTATGTGASASTILRALWPDFPPIAVLRRTYI